MKRQNELSPTRRSGTGRQKLAGNACLAMLLFFSCFYELLLRKTKISQFQGRTDPGNTAWGRIG